MQTGKSFSQTDLRYLAQFSSNLTLERALSTGRRSLEARPVELSRPITLETEEDEEEDPLLT